MHPLHSLLRWTWGSSGWAPVHSIPSLYSTADENEMVATRTCPSPGSPIAIPTDILKGPAHSKIVIHTDREALLDDVGCQVLSYPVQSSTVQSSP